LLHGTDEGEIRTEKRGVKRGGRVHSRRESKTLKGDNLIYLEKNKTKARGDINRRLKESSDHRGGETATTSRRTRGRWKTEPYGVLHMIRKEESESSRGRGDARLKDKRGAVAEEEKKSSFPEKPGGSGGGEPKGQSPSGTDGPRKSATGLEKNERGGQVSRCQIGHREKNQTEWEWQRERGLVGGEGKRGGKTQGGNGRGRGTKKGPSDHGHAGGGRKSLKKKRGPAQTKGERFKVHAQKKYRQRGIHTSKSKKERLIKGS